MAERTRPHYSNQTAHRARSEFWQDMRRALPRHQPLPDKIPHQLGRFQMRRVKESGRK